MALPAKWLARQWPKQVLGDRRGRKLQKLMERVHFSVFSWPSESLAALVGVAAAVGRGRNKWPGR